jgi:FMN phosphatase YigB (HAD superfamily)
MQEHHDDDLIDERAAARILGMSTAWLQRDRWAGATVPFVRMGRAIRYRVGTLRDEIRKRTVQAA